MAGKKKKAKKKKPKKILTALERRLLREKRKHPGIIRKIFGRLGFQSFKVDGTHFQVGGRTGELDGLYLFENVLVLTEITTGSEGSSHLLKKKPFYDNIAADIPKFISILQTQFPALKPVLGVTYSPSEYRVRIIYAPFDPPGDELIAACPGISFIYGATKKYFGALVNAVAKSARFEFFSFLGLKWKDVGEAVQKAVGSTSDYEGHLLPESKSSYPDGYKILSFYADAETLLSKCYVLRRDGWRDENGLYQRIIEPKKIGSMRRYLVDEGRVFVNNVIVTLPEGTQINEIDAAGQNVSSKDLHESKPVSIAIPAQFNTIGIVDGQHRIFCYHEGDDDHEVQMKVMRKKQHLLVTGIKYPPKTSEAEKLKFEAKLFLEINSNQTRTRPALTQDIELLVRPFSGIAVARRIIGILAQKGAYKDLFHTSYFDPSYKIKTSSIVSYGLRPLVKFEGDDSLFARFGNGKKQSLVDETGFGKKSKEATQSTVDLLSEYVNFCTEVLARYFLSAKMAYGTEAWSLDAKPRSELLRPTVINGLIACLRLIVKDGKPISESAFKAGFANIGVVKFGQYKSSAWQELGKKIYEKCFS